MDCDTERHWIAIWYASSGDQLQSQSAENTFQLQLFQYRLLLAFPHVTYKPSQSTQVPPSWHVMGFLWYFSRQSLVESPRVHNKQAKLDTDFPWGSLNIHLINMNVWYLKNQSRTAECRGGEMGRWREITYWKQAVVVQWDGRLATTCVYEPPRSGYTVKKIGSIEYMIK